MEVIIKRNTAVYANRELAIAALDKLTYEVGLPVCATYTDDTETKVLLVLGNGDGVGKYKIIASFSDITDVTEALSAINTGLQNHIKTFADGTTGGHVIGSDLSDIEWTKGVGTIKPETIDLSHFAKAPDAGLIGIASGDVTSGDAPMDFLSWAQVVSEIEKAGSISIKTKDNQVISLSGKAEQIVVTISNSITLPGNPKVGTSVAVGGELDKDGGLEIANIDYVRKKIDSVLAAGDAMHYLGQLDPATTKLPTGDAGDTYVISNNVTTETDLTGLGEMHVGDLLICKTDGTAAETSDNWELVETHKDTIFGPSGAVDKDIVIFSGTSGKVAKDSGVSIDNIVKDTRKITVSDGLELDSSNITGTLDKDVVIKHTSITPTVTGTPGDGKFISQITEDARGHVTSVTYTPETDLSQTDGTGVVNGAAENGKYISEVIVNGHDITVTATDLPGTVKVDSQGTADYLINQIVPKAILGTDEYAVKLEKNTTTGKIEASVVITRIDGGTY